MVLEPNVICTESYLLLSAFDNQEQAENMMSYVKTIFFRFLMSTILLTQNIAKDKFAFIPIQDWSKPWNDAELYKKYAFTEDEIAYIDVLNKKLNVMDSTATTLCMDNNIPILVYNMNVKGNLLKVVTGESIGTIVK